MIYKEFANKAILIDKRNVFSECTDDLSEYTKEIAEFYRYTNPIDVEIDYNGSAVHFVPFTQLKNLQGEYLHFNVGLVFATCNGDPIFLQNDGGIYTCSHGNQFPKFEKLAESFDDYLGNFFS